MSTALNLKKKIKKIKEYEDEKTKEYEETYLFLKNLDYVNLSKHFATKQLSEYHQIIDNIDNNDDDFHKFHLRKMRRRFFSYNVLLKHVFKIYQKVKKNNYNPRYVKITEDNKYGFRICVNQFVMNYYELFGATSNLMMKLLRNKMWYLIAYINGMNEDPIILQKSMLRKVSHDDMIELHKIGYKFDKKSDLSIKFLLNSRNVDEIMEKILSYPKKQILNNIYLIKDMKLFDYLIDHDIIELNKKFIKKLHVSCNVSILNHLMNTRNIIPTNANIKNLFTKTNKKTILDKRFSRSRRRSKMYYRRKNLDLRTKSMMNVNTKKNDFKENIGQFIDNILRSDKIDFDPKPYIGNVLLHNKLYDVFYKLYLDEGNPKNINYNKKVSLILFKKYLMFLIENDELDKFKRLIDYNFLIVKEIHEDKNFIIQGIRHKSMKICKYLIDDLKVKCLSIRYSKLFGWSFADYDTDGIIDRIKFMKEIGVQIDNSLLSNAINYAKSDKILDYLIDEIGIKINKHHLTSLSECGYKKFIKYTKNLNLNLNTVIKGFITAKSGGRFRFYYGRESKSKNSLILKLIALLPEKKDKEKMTKKLMNYSSLALSNGHANLFCSLWMRFHKKYDLSYDDKNLETFFIKPLCAFVLHKQNGRVYMSRENAEYSCVNIVNTIANYQTNDLKELLKKTLTQKDKLEIFCSDYHKIKDDRTQQMIQTIKEYEIDVDQELIDFFIENFDGRQHRGERIHYSSELFISLIKMSKEYISNDKEGLKKIITRLLCRGKFDVIISVTTKTRDLVNLISRKELYASLLDTYYRSEMSSDVIRFIARYKEKLSPYLFTILVTGHLSRDANYEVWNKKQLTNKDIDKLIEIQNEITEDDHKHIRDLFYNHRCDGRNKKYLSNFNRLQIVKYEPTNDEIPDMIGVYTNMIDRVHRENDDDSTIDVNIGVDDMDNALNDAILNGQIKNDNNLNDLDSLNDLYGLNDLDSLDSSVNLDKKIVVHKRNLKQRK